MNIAFSSGSLMHLIDPVVIGVAHEYEAVRRDPRGIDPRLQAGQADIVEPVLAVHPMMQSGPIAPGGGFHLGLQIRCIGVARVKLLQVMRRPINEQRPGAGDRRKEVRIGRRPGVTDRALVDDLEARRLAVDEQRIGQPEWRYVLVVGHVLPVVAEVFCGEGPPVRPLVALTQVERERLLVRHVQTIENIRNQV